jgi:hypothetical protein
MARPKTKYKDYIQGGELYLCGIQYERYLGNLDSMTNKDISLYYATSDKLAKLHAQGVYHLDIKSPNLCFFSETDVRFADWGLSCVNTLNKLETITLGYERLSPHFLQYYNQLARYTLLQSAVQKAGMVFSEIKSLLKDITYYYLSKYVEERDEVIVDTLEAIGIGSDLASFLHSKYSNKVERNMEDVENFAEIIYMYSKSHSRYETMQHISDMTTINSEIEDFIYFIYYHSDFDMDAWLVRSEKIYTQTNQAFKIIDNCLLASAFVGYMGQEKQIKEHLNELFLKI